MDRQLQQGNSINHKKPVNVCFHLHVCSKRLLAKPKFHSSTPAQIVHILPSSVTAPTFWLSSTHLVMERFLLAETLSQHAAAIRGTLYN
jgi:hypothetical protein